MEYDDPDACHNEDCVWLFPHRSDGMCRSDWRGFGPPLNDDDDPALL